MKLLNKKGLAEAIGQAPGYVSAAQAAGYEMEYGNRTTLAHFLVWRRLHKSFRTTDYYRAHRRPPGGVKVSRAGKSCEQAR
jgi:hypothetical protein